MSNQHDFSRIELIDESISVDVVNEEYIKIEIIEEIVEV